MKKRLAIPKFLRFESLSDPSESNTFVPLTRKNAFYGAENIECYPPFRNSKSLPVRDSPLMFIDEVHPKRRDLIILLWIDEIYGSRLRPLSPLSDTTIFSPFRSSEFSEQLRQESYEKYNISPTSPEI